MKRSLRVGDSVKAKYKRGTKFFPGKITRVRTDGTFDVQFEDGDTAKHVDEHSIQQVDEKADHDATKKQVFKVGEIVQAPFQQSLKLYRGKIVRVRSDGTYDVDFDDGDKDTRVKGDRIQVVALMNEKSKTLTVGDKVRARFKKEATFFNGKVKRVHSDGTYDVDYDDGDVETRVAIDLIEVLDDSKLEQEERKTERTTFKVGDRVRARYNKGTKKVKGAIIGVHRDDTFDIRYDDGDEEKKVRLQDIELDEEEGSSSELKVGDRVEATYTNSQKVFAGTISRVHSDGTYDIKSHDGDVENRVARSRIQGMETSGGTDSERQINSKRSGDTSKSRTAGTELGTSFKVGDGIKARYKKGTQFVAGTIARVRLDGTYDVRYEDGALETHVERNLVKGARGYHDKDGDGRSSGTLSIGDRVTARYKGGVHRFSGTIAKIRMDGTYDIDYDDGDKEARVERAAIEAVNDGEKTRKRDGGGIAKDNVLKKSDSEESRVKKIGYPIHVGDVVDGNFKQKGKFYRGKIIRVRSDGTYDIEYDVGTLEKCVRVENLVFPDKIEVSDEVVDSRTNPKQLSDKTTIMDSESNVKMNEKAASIESEDETRDLLKKGARVTYRKALDLLARRIGRICKVHSDKTCDIQYKDGDTSKRVASALLVECSDSDESEDNLSSSNRFRKDSETMYCRQERVMSCWRRPSRFSNPRMTKDWIVATILEKNSDGTYTIRDSDGAVEEDVPVEALKSIKSDEVGFSIKTDFSSKRRKRRRQRSVVGTESLFLLEQLAMTLFEEGRLSRKPKLQLLEDRDSSSSASSSSSPDTDSSSSTKRDDVDKTLQRLFDASFLQKCRHAFLNHDVKHAKRISQRRVIALVDDLINIRPHTSQFSLYPLLSDYFASHDELRPHRHFDFHTFFVAFAYASHRLGKFCMEQSVARALNGRKASNLDNIRQVEQWQALLGDHLFEPLQQAFLAHAMPDLVPLRLLVSKVERIFAHVSRKSTPQQPVDVYLHSQHLAPHQTLLLSEFLCCYYEVYGLDLDSLAIPPRNPDSCEVRPLAFLASCLFANGDPVCQRHSALVQRLCMGRTQAQVELIGTFRASFEALQAPDSTDFCHLATSQLPAFAATVTLNPILVEKALQNLRERAESVSLVEIFATCGSLIDDVTAAPTLAIAIERLRLRHDLAVVRRLLGVLHRLCGNILHYPHNTQYWRIRADTIAFERKLGRFDGASTLLEAVGFVKYCPTHYEVSGIRDGDGKRVRALAKATLDLLGENRIVLEHELALLDGVESLGAIFQRCARAWAVRGHCVDPDALQRALTSLLEYLDNILKNPKDARCWRIRETNRIFQRQVGWLPYAVDLMDSIGFELVPTSQGNVYTLRGTGAELGKQRADCLQESTPGSSISTQMEWFLWRRKQEIQRLLADNLSILGPVHSRLESASRVDFIHDRDAGFIEMYPYGTNALERFGHSSIQKQQLAMIRHVYRILDTDGHGFFTEVDFSRVLGPSAALPLWSRFEAFDIGKDGRVDFPDLVAALGPLLDHPFEVNPTGDERDGTDFSLCDVTSLLVGKLCLETSRPRAMKVVETVVNRLLCMIQEPGNPSFWSITDTEMIGKQILCVPAGRALLVHVGFRESKTTMQRIYRFEPPPQRVRLTLSDKSADFPRLLDAAMITRMQTIAATLTGHYRGLQLASVSDVNAVSRALASDRRDGAAWLGAVHFGLKCLVNIAENPDNIRFRALNPKTKTFLNVVACVPGGVDLLRFIGFQETDTETLVLPVDVSIEEVKARRLEVEIGVALIHLRAQKSGSGAVDFCKEVPTGTGEREISALEGILEVQKDPGLNLKGSALAQRVKIRSVTLKPRPVSTQSGMVLMKGKNRSWISCQERKGRGRGRHQRSGGRTNARGERPRDRLGWKQEQQRASQPVVS